MNIVSLLAEFDCSIVEPDTAEGTRRLLQRWIALTPAERARMSDGAFRCYRERLDLRENSGAMVKLFDEVIAGRKGTAR